MSLQRYEIVKVVCYVCKYGFRDVFYIESTGCVIIGVLSRIGEVVCLRVVSERVGS